MCSSRDDRVTVTLLSVKRTEIGETVFKGNNLSLLTTCVSMDVTKSIPLERIDDRQDRLKIETKSLFLLYHSGLQFFLLTHSQSQPCPVPGLMLKGGVNAEGGVETLQITALSSSDGKVQALDVTRRIQQLQQQGLLLLRRRMRRVQRVWLLFWMLG